MTRRKVSLGKIPLLVPMLVISGIIVVVTSCLPKQDEHLETRHVFFDAVALSKVPVVLRVEWQSQQGGSKYSWQSVKVMDVIKNQSDVSIDINETIKVAHQGHGNGVPFGGRCTVYLCLYNELHPEFGWKLASANNGALMGVSHKDQSKIDIEALLKERGAIN